jgi:alpha-tubulin suppressor-like RCC1 family protein
MTVGFKLKKAVCGDYHTMALTEDGNVLTWGGTLHKKLGNNPEAMEFYYYDEEVEDYPSPYIVKNLYRRNITDISCGDFHSVALEDSGAIYTWGGGGVSYNKG